MAFKSVKKNFSKPNFENIFHLYQPMLITLLAFGYDFNFYQKTILHGAAKLYCIILVSTISFASMTCCDPQEISQIWSLLEYSSSVLIILFFKSKMRVFLKKLKEVDVYLRIKRNHYLRVKYRMFVFTAIVWIVRLYYTYSYCNYYACYRNLLLYMLSMLSPLALDLSRVWRCILFDTIRYRLTMLRVRLEEDPEVNYYLYVKNNKTLKEDKLKFCLHLYRLIVDLMDLVSPELYASLFVSVACNLPKLIFNVYHILAVLEGIEPKESLSFVAIHMIQICVLLFAPFVIVEFYAVEVEKIKLFLIHRFIDENDAEMKEEIDVFLRYIQIRPFKCKIWRIIPINVSIPLEMINLCTTYVIVIINFTHLYG